MSDSGYIILRDIPKYVARIDLFDYKIQGGFRGFQQVPSGIHYVSVENDKIFIGFWCSLTKNDTIVKVFNDKKKQFEDDTDESSKNYRGLAQSGSMDKYLAIYDDKYKKAWKKLTDYIKFDKFPPQINNEIPILPPINLPPKK